MGITTEDEAKTLYNELKGLLSVISLPLAKWATNSQELQGTQVDIPFNDEVQVLGAH